MQCTRTKQHKYTTFAWLKVCCCRATKTYKNVVLDKGAFEVQPINSDNDSVAMTTVVKPQTHVLLSYQRTSNVVMSNSKLGRQDLA